MNGFNHEVRKSLGIIYDELRKNGKLIVSFRGHPDIIEERYAYKDDREGMVYTVLYDTRKHECISINYERAIVSIDKSSMYDDVLIGGVYERRST